jgi:MFS family permease
VSLLGKAMAPVALAFAVLEASRRDSDLGLGLAARTGPFVIFSLFGGVLADRYPRDKVAVLGHLGAAMTQGFAALLLIEGHFDLTVIMMTEALNGTIAALIVPRLFGAVPQLVELGQVRRANALLGSSRQAAMIAGPVLAGWLTASVGGGWALAVDAASYLVAAVCLARLRLPPTVPERRPGIWTELREGWSEFRGTAWLWPVTLGDVVALFCLGGLWLTLGPVVAEHSFGPGGWGLVLACYSAGFLAMSLVMYRLRVRRLLRFGIRCRVLCVLPIVPLALGAPLGQVLLMAFLGGLGVGAFVVAWETSTQEHIPEEKLSRVIAYDLLGSFATLPIGQVVAVPLVGAFGIERVFAFGGLLWLAGILAPLAVPAVRELEHGDEVEDKRFAQAS